MFAAYLNHMQDDSEFIKLILVVECFINIFYWIYILYHYEWMQVKHVGVNIRRKTHIFLTLFV